MRSIRSYFFLILGALLFQACNSEKNSESGAMSNVTKKQVFKLLSSEKTGIDFVNSVTESEDNNYFNNQYIYNGGGVAVGDINNDGLDDIYFTGNQTDDKLYLNKGNLEFEDITVPAGIKVGDGSWSTGVSFVDLNADGWLDIYVCKAGVGQTEENRRNQLYFNLKNNTFLLSAETNLADPSLTTQASFFDYDGDSDLDVYLINYPENFDASQLSEGVTSIPYEDSDHFYRNDGSGTFTDVTEEAGLMNYAFGLGVITADFNGDFFPDIYVANDYIENDYLYINAKNGTFRESVKKHTGHNSQSSMGIDRADVNNDGYEDFFVAEMLPSDYKRSKENMASMDIESFWYSISQGNHFQYMHNVLQVDHGNGYYSDVSQMAGVDKTDWSWSPVMEDFDNDGKIDLFISNGIKKDMLNKDARNKRKSMEKSGEKLGLDAIHNMIPSTKLSNYMYQNQGDYQFKDVTQDWGLGQLSFSNGATSSDLDNDGDLDLVVNNLEDKAFIYENQSSANGNDFLTVELKWPRSPNVHAVNAKVEIYSGSEILSREVLPTAGYQSGRSNSVHFGLGQNLSIDSARVIWPLGTVQPFSVNSVNKTITVDYKPLRTLSFDSAEKYFIEESAASRGLAFVHQENRYNDFEKEILLPHRQSTLGPALEVGDVNGDGLDDVFIGGSTGQKSALYLQDVNGQFSPVDLYDRTEWEIRSAIISDFDNDGDGDLYLVNGSTEPEIERRDMFYLNQSQSGMIEYPRGRPGMEWQNGSCVTSADFDGNGYDDLFVGAGSKPNQYPLSDSSYLILFDQHSFKPSENNWFSDLPEAGFITSAVASDFNNDGKPDLVLAGEWLPVMFYENTGSGFKNVTADFGFENEIGWWYSLEVADLNGDGFDDVIAGNIGLNHKFRPTADKPFVIYYDDYDGNGQGDIVLANTGADGSCLPVRGKQCMSEQMPFISEEKVSSYNDFANSDLNQLLGKNVEDSRVKLQANQFASSIFYSDGKGGFSRKNMPMEAQKSPVNGIEVLDVNMDGELDLVLSGNMYDTEVETTRADAGVGCVLLSGTKPIRNSGFFTPGNVKNTEVIEIQNEPYILVANNNGPLQLFKVLDKK